MTYLDRFATFLNTVAFNFPETVFIPLEHGMSPATALMQVRTALREALKVSSHPEIPYLDKLKEARPRMCVDLDEVNSATVLVVREKYAKGAMPGGTKLRRSTGIPVIGPISVPDSGDLAAFKRLLIAGHLDMPLVLVGDQTEHFFETAVLFASFDSTRNETIITRI